jgi:hypothetical protein
MSVPSKNIEPNKKSGTESNPDNVEGSQTDPQKTEMKGLKKGGVEPVVNEEDKPKDGKGRKEK